MSISLTLPQGDLGGKEILRAPDISVGYPGKPILKDVTVNIYRGAGRPEAALLMETLVDKAARRSGIDPVEQYAHEFIEQSVIVYFNNYLAQVESGQIVHQPRGDAAIRQGALISLLA